MCCAFQVSVAPVTASASGRTESGVRQSAPVAGCLTSRRGQVSGSAHLDPLDQAREKSIGQAAIPEAEALHTH